ncbi:TRAP transporter small permease [Paracoccus xiamenensis]|uniref:TRAP transporter small permease n=1 Tax=Paracoccus xiamenensis TaxID=2714901 RepID=UPI00140C8700|nr:TRAP transporter small permease subunit [Paracoccus xiamenensis]NHF71788.1 TRAP transporter small permease subunit [Paracoccus xiamenensis]
MSGKPLADRLDGLVRNIGAAGVAVLGVLVFYVVVSRYAVAKTPRWSEEVPRLILVWVTFFGVVSAFIRGSHFRAGLTDLILPPGALRRAVFILAALAGAAFLVVLLITGIQITRFTWGHQMTATSLPGGLLYLALPISSALSLLGLALGGWRK